MTHARLACLCRCALLAPVAAVLALQSACQSSRATPAPSGLADGAGRERHAASDLARSGVTTPAMIDGQSVGVDELWPLLVEAGGLQCLQEVALDRALEVELARRGRSVSERDMEAERTLLVESLAADRTTAGLVLEQLRVRDRLGPARFAALLRRNAALRALVREQVQITDAALATAYDLVAGPKRQVRIIAVPTLAESQRVLARLSSGASFSDLAVELSTDASAARGGLLEPLARQDPAYPESLRAAIFALSPGQVSQPVLLSEGYVVASLEREIPATGQSMSSLRPQLERAVRLTQERLMMDQLARRLLRERRVTVFDDGLSWAWQAQ